jgi:uncharacterized membrane protein SirB2
MVELYPQIKLVHVTAVLLSGGLFLLRGVGVQLGQRWPMAPAVRYTSYAIDTVLLTAAVLLVVVLRQYPFVHSWLTAKVMLLPVYIVLGSFALKRGRTRRVRAACFLAALAVFCMIFSIARSHHILGFLPRL